MDKRTSYIEKKLVGKTIKTAVVNGFEVYLGFTDGSKFEYDASDGGYSTYGLYDVCKSPSKPSLP